ncbi:MAG: mechanosensitive ion channel family protein [archaeon]
MRWPGEYTDSLLASTTTASGNPTTETAVDQATQWIPTWTPGWVIDLLSIVVVLALAWVSARILISLFGRRIAQRFRRPSLTRTFIRGIRVGVFLLALLVILRIFGLELGDIALSVTVFSAVVGVVLAPIVGSVISGIFLLADQPYEIGDMVELVDTDQRGFVEDITLRYTKIFTLDNSFLVIPNGTIRERDVMNYSAEDSRTRRSLDVLITYESDVEIARERIERAARNIDGVIEGGPNIRVGAARYPAGPTCYFKNFGDNGILLRLRYWVEEPYRLLAVNSRVKTAIWEAFEDIDVEIAYPHSHVVFDETSGQLHVQHGEGDFSENYSRPLDPSGDVEDESSNDHSSP